jgi:HEAT repeat protein
MTASLPITAHTDTTGADARLDAADEHVRRVALLELADQGEPDAVPRIVDLLYRDPSATVRQEAARVLAEWEQDDVVEGLCAALLDTHEAVRRAAAQSLSELKDPRSALTLLKWAGRPEPFVRASVLRGLRELRCPEAFTAAYHALDETTPAVRLEAVNVLGWLKDARALPPLTHRVTFDPEPEVRRAAASALGFASSEDDAVASALLGALADGAWQVREQAAATLGKLGVPSAAEPLIAALEDSYWQVRQSAVRALGRLRAVSAAAAVASLLRHPIGNLRKEAALALGEIGSPNSRLALEEASQDGDPEVRKSARIALAQIDQANR